MAIELGFLGDHPEWLETVARCWFAEWGHFRPQATLESWIGAARQQLSREQLPLHLVAYSGSTLLGTASLKRHELIDRYPELEPWLGNVFVVPEARDRGLASRLTLEVVKLARSRAVATIHLQTERLDGGLYAKLGFEPIEESDVGEERVLVMKRAL